MMMNLESLLIDLARSLLQYVGECWLWTARGEERRLEVLEQLIERQQEHIAALVELMISRRRPVELGNFPDRFSDYHFVSLDYLLSELVRQEEGLIGRIEETVRSTTNDTEAVGVLMSILTGEREILAQLREQAAAPQTSVAT